MGGINWGKDNDEYIADARRFTVGLKKSEGHATLYED
jgi:hypothetical protein